MVTAAEADRIVAEYKAIAMNLTWRFDSLIQGYRLQADALHEASGEILRLVGYVGEVNRSFVLLYRNSPIRKFTVHNYLRHRDPINGRVFREPHKHFWHDVHRDHPAYIPDDIRIGDPNEELIDFLAECNISLRGSYIPQSFFQESPG